MAEDGELVMRAAPAHDCRSHAENATAESAWSTADQSADFVTAHTTCKHWY